MTKRIGPSALAIILCIPLVHYAIGELTPPPAIDFAGATWQARAALVARAQVFVNSPPDIASLDLSRTPNDPSPFELASTIECRYVSKPAKATSAKFDCRLPDGDIVKVKYGWSPERSGEVAAGRLLAALGFGADHMTRVPRLRCLGCPYFPFEMRKVAEAFYAVPLLELLTPKSLPRNFQWVAVERKLAGRAIRVEEHEGWDWSELATVDPAKGGATRAEIDALRLTAIFLAHWDNKASNQRLACEVGGDSDDPRAPCAMPLLMLQDVGATFGPTKVQHDKWAATPIWADPARCLISMEAMPYQGGQLKPIEISEAGRVLIASKLTQFSEPQIRALFESARFPDPATDDVTGNVTAWVNTFQDKVRQIAARPACPSLPN